MRIIEVRPSKAIRWLIDGLRGTGSRARVPGPNGKSDDQGSLGWLAFGAVGLLAWRKRGGLRPQPWLDGFVRRGLTNQLGRIGNQPLTPIAARPICLARRF